MDVCFRNKWLKSEMKLREGYTTKTKENLNEQRQYTPSPTTNPIHFPGHQNASSSKTKVFRAPKLRP